MSVTAINVSGMSVTVNTEEGGHGSMGAGQSRAAAGSGSGSLRKARIRPDTAAQIAARAGQTERTFFRHLAGKREELFGGSALLQGQIAAGVAEAPPEDAPLDAVALDSPPPSPCSASSAGTCPASDTPSSPPTRSWGAGVGETGRLSPSRHRPMAR